MAEESSSPARLDTLTKHVSEYRSPLSLLSQFFFDLLDLFEQMIATDEVLLKYPGVDAAAMHLAKDLVKCLIEHVEQRSPKVCRLQGGDQPKL
jgi:hypothetical protein